MQNTEKIMEIKNIEMKPKKKCYHIKNKRKSLTHWNQYLCECKVKIIQANNIAIIGSQISLASDITDDHIEPH